MTRFACLALIVAACGGGSHAVKEPAPTPDPVPKTAGPSCNDVAAHIVQMAGGADPAQDTGKLGEVVRVRCGADHWSDEARSCFGTMQSEPEADGCAKLLTPEQKSAMERATQNTNAANAPPAPGAAPPPPAPAAVGAAPAPDPAPASHSRGATKKAKPKTGNPCDGGQ